MIKLIKLKYLKGDGRTAVESVAFREPHIAGEERTSMLTAIVSKKELIRRIDRKLSKSGRKLRRPLPKREDLLGIARELGVLRTNEAFVHNDGEVTTVMVEADTREEAIARARQLAGFRSA